MKALLLATALSLMASASLAQSAPVTVNLTGAADMPSIADKDALDHFNFTVSDVQFSTSFKLECTGAGHQALMFIRKDRICAFQKGSDGAIINPKTNQSIPRAQYVGSYTVTKSGLTDAETLAVNYLAASTALVSESNIRFGGSLNLKPEQSSTGAAGLKAAILSKLAGAGEGLTNDAIDTIDFNNFVVPSPGMPTSMGQEVTWSGNAAYSYQTYSWYFNLKAVYKNQTYALQGNMPFTGDSETEGGISYYDAVLSLPTTGTGSPVVNSFDDLFSDASAGTDLFQQADGISAHIEMQNTRIVATKVDDETIKTPGRVTVTSGTFTGQGVPVEVVRSFATIIALLPATFFGP